MTDDEINLRIDAMNVEEMAIMDYEAKLQAEVDAIPYWYHRIDLAHGVTTPGWAPLDASMYRIPDDLTGKLVLDVGAWDGYWTFEALKRGAKHVTALDDFSDTCGSVTNASRSSGWETFRLCRSALGYSRTQAEELQGSVYDLDEQFRVEHVFCFGVLYHLQHPFLALQKMRAVCTESIHIETAILDGCKSAYTDYRYNGSECCAEFYPNDEYGMNASNWHVGTLRYWAALVEAAGFKNIETWRLTEHPSSIAECRGFIKATT